MRRFWIVFTVAAVVAGLAAAGSFAARGRHHGRNHRKGMPATLLHAQLAPSVPTDPTLAGATPGAAPWVLKSGRVVLTTGHLELHLKGFLIPGTGTGPVKTVDASLYCNGSTSPAATTAAVALSPSGDATIAAKLTAPKTCLAPLVLVHPNGAAASYVAASGWKS